MDHRNVYSTNNKINRFLLAHFLAKNLPMELNQAIASANDYVSGANWKKFKIGVTAIAFIIAFLVFSAFVKDTKAIIIGGLLLTIYTLLTACDYRDAKNKTEVCEKYAAKARDAEKVFAAVFPGYEKIWITNRALNKDATAFMYAVDYARSEILKIVIQIENGCEGKRELLRLKFDIAKELFGNDLDHSCGYGNFWNRSILESMHDFVGQFRVPAISES